MTETPNTQSLWPVHQQRNKKIRIVNTGGDSKQVYAWRESLHFQSHKLQNSFNIKPNSFVWIHVFFFLIPLECHYFTLDLNEVKLTRTKKEHKVQCCQKTRPLTPHPQLQQLAVIYLIYVTLAMSKAMKIVPEPS